MRNKITEKLVSCVKIYGKVKTKPVVVGTEKKQLDSSPEKKLWNKQKIPGEFWGSEKKRTLPFWGNNYQIIGLAGSETGPDCPESPQSSVPLELEGWTGLSKTSPPVLSQR